MKSTVGSTCYPSRQCIAKRHKLDSGELGPLKQYLFTILLVTLATGLGWLGRGFLYLPDLTIVYLYVIIATALLFSFGPAVVAAVLSVLAFDFFFVPPIFEFNLADIHYVFSFSMMLLIGVLVNALAFRIRSQRRVAIEKERQTYLLYSLAQSLGTADNEQAMCELLVGFTKDALGVQAAFFASDCGGLVFASNVGGIRVNEHVQQAAQWALTEGQAAGAGTKSHPEAPVTCVPVSNGHIAYGVLAVERPRTVSLGQAVIGMLDSSGKQTGLSIAALRAATELRTAELRIRTEAMRSSLLSAVSHDLRTPLSVISEAASMLRDDGHLFTSAQRLEMLSAVCEGAARMDQFIEKLLEMTRLDAGHLELKREWVPCDELISSALSIIGDKAAYLDITTTLDVNLPPIYVDASLLEHALANLLENVAKYAGSRARVDITMKPKDGLLVIEVGDDGPGIRPGLEEKIFEKFFRASQNAKGGTGLGLPICRAIVELHGGTIGAKNRAIGGAVFSMRIPLTEVPSDLVLEEVMIAVNSN
jgi:two-component system sensor histidine kinase KdpD